jgi:hypothetical protein
VCGLLLLSVSFTLEARSSSSPVSVQLVSSVAGPESFMAQLRLTSNDGAIGVHIALVPGTSQPPVNRVFVLYDPGIFLRFGTATDVVGLEARVSDYLSHLTPSIPVSLVDAASVASALTSNPHAAFVDFAYSTIPDTILSENTSMLKLWIEGGGTLIWAGGPLAYFEGHITSSGGFVYDNLGWGGQTDLAGYPLEDPIGNPATTSYGPLLGTTESPIGAALGVTYSGTPDGANTTELESHGGTDLGYDSPPQGSASPRTSLAFAPIGLGRLFYFGGAIWGDAVGIVPDADATLSTDIELLLGTGYLPLPGPATFTSVSIAYLHSSIVALQVTGTYVHMVVIVTCTFGPTSLFIWSREVI